jgi:type IV fimbrial biogenesis protein FimT
MKAQSGFTLIELVLVVTIIGIIATMATLSYSRLNEKSRVESYTKDIYSLLMRARNDAANINANCTVTLAANQIQTIQDRNRDGDVTDSGETVSTDFPQFTITYTASSVFFDRRGITNNIQTIRITGYSANIEPAMDCIVIANTRINIGKFSGATCVQR